jgi:hypothetical protein
MNRKIKLLLSRVFLTIVTIMIIGSCDASVGGAYILKDYAYEIRKISGMEGETFTSRLQPYPSRRTILLKTQDIRTNFLDFFSLDRCHLQELIAEKNSAMGRVMPDSRLLRWENLFLINIKECLGKLEQEPDPDHGFISKMDSIMTVKQANLPLVYWNATFGSLEFQNFFSLAGGTLPADIKKETLNPIYDAFSYLAKLGPVIGNQKDAIDIVLMEKYLYHLQKERAGGNLLQSMEHLIFYLENVSEHLHSIRGMDPDTVTVKLRNGLIQVFKDNYRLLVQPYLTGIHQTGDRLFSEIEQLYQQQTVEIPEPFAEYYHLQLSKENPDGLWQRFEGAIRQHNEAWQGVIDAFQLRVYE